MEFLCYLLIPSLAMGILGLYLANKQSKVAKSFQVGDKVVFGGQEGEIIEKTGDITYVLKIEVSGMRLVKKG